ncbi:MAG: hypothetical protein IIU03_13365 [Bacteroidales bacterium]|nr:hypothetical protein [Bacteroidales bacterium]
MLTAEIETAPINDDDDIAIDLEITYLGILQHYNKNSSRNVSFGKFAL